MNAPRANSVGGARSGEPPDARTARWQCPRAHRGTSNSSPSPPPTRPAPRLPGRTRVKIIGAIGGQDSFLTPVDPSFELEGWSWRGPAGLAGRAAAGMDAAGVRGDVVWASGRRRRALWSRGTPSQTSPRRAPAGTARPPGACPVSQRLRHYCLEVGTPVMLRQPSTVAGPSPAASAAPSPAD